MVHGIGGHGGTFARAAAALAPRGYGLAAIDLPGHGRSNGQRGWVSHWPLLGQAVADVLADLAGEAAGKPVFLLGHSMGGTVVLDLLERQPLQLAGVILSNPALDASGVAPWRRAASHLLARTWPRFSLPLGIPIEAASGDPSLQAEIAADPLRHDRCSARLGAELMDAMARLRGRPAQLRSPLLLLLSGGDAVTPPEAARRFFAAVVAPDKTLISYPRSRHELLNDVEHDQVLADIADWLDRHGD